MLTGPPMQLSRTIAGRPRTSRILRRWAAGSLPGIAFSALVGLLLQDLLAAAGVLVLLAVWSTSLRWGLPSAVPAMISLHWMQLNLGIYYVGLTGRELGDQGFDISPMAWLGLVYLLVLYGGFCLGARTLRGSAASEVPRVARRERTQALQLYLIWLPLGFVLTAVAWRLPGITQQVLAIAQLRLVFLCLLMQRLVALGAWRQALILLAVEVCLGLTGFYSDFKTPMMLTLIVLLDAHRAGKAHAGRAALFLLGATFALSLVWTGIKGEVRSAFRSDESRVDRLTRALSRTLEWVQYGELLDTIDQLVDRIWELEYPARVLERVPSEIPHEDGRLLLGAVRHVLIPRLVDPSKPALISDSELVRRYAGVQVAGAESSTSIGLSYLAESYIDFGVPLLFLPILIFGWLVGAMLSFLHGRLQQREFAAAVTTSLLAITLNKFEVPWTKVLGSAITTIVLVGAFVALWQRFDPRGQKPPR